MKHFVLTAAMTLVATATHADVKMPALFGDHMVLQRDIPVKLWGQADAGEEITVTLGDQKAVTKAGDDGKWSVQLKPLTADGKALTLTVAGKNKLTFSNVLAGDVWVCSGQSNMEWPVSMSDNPRDEIAAAKFPNIRLFTVGKTPRAQSADDVLGAWAVCSSETIPNFSAVAYFFGREINQKTKVPIGLINTSWGGTAIEPWMPFSALNQLDETKDRVREFEKRLAEFDKNRADFTEKIFQAVEKNVSLRQEWFDNLAAADPGAKDNWQDPATDVSKWKQAAVPMAHEKNVFENYLGFAWMRKDVEIPADWVGKALTLRLGPIDDGDKTYINGVEVGAMWLEHQANAWLTSRTYTIPAKVVDGRKLAIVVRMYNMMGALGPLGDASQYTLAPAEDDKAKPISLAGQWRYALGDAINPNTQPRVGVPSVPGENPGDVGALYHGMIAPLTGFGIRGAIWYQGESNGNQGELYAKFLPGMIGGWRQAWGQGDFPFYVVQLSNFLASVADPIQKDSWAGVREAQLTTARTFKNTGLAVAIDIGDAADIHPKNKQDVGRRLALWALAKDYGVKDLVYSGPWYKSMAVEGSSAVLSFEHVGSGLVAKDGPLLGFAVAGEDKVFHHARAQIKGDTVIVTCPEVDKPAAVRYGWSFNPPCNLYNKENLPASPFRTDDWNDKDVKVAEKK